jgi:hypothetical protein
LAAGGPSFEPPLPLAPAEGAVAPAFAPAFAPLIRVVMMMIFLIKKYGTLLIIFKYQNKYALIIMINKIM